MINSFALSLPLEYIQSIRLAHALMETKYRVYIPLTHEEKFIALKKRFNARYSMTDQSADYRSIQVLPGLKVVHSQPQTCVGSIERPLIFPHAVVSHCRRIWFDRRDIRFSFAGLVTESRKVVLEQWVEKNFDLLNLNLSQPSPPSKFQHFQSRLARKLGLISTSAPVESRLGEIVFWSSTRGRSFPTKSWDHRYFNLLAKTQFSLCPRGDHVWTYRFFEAALCGSIPVIEAYDPIYSGFRFRTLEESPQQFVWSQVDAEHNYALCRERLTIPTLELEAEIEKLLSTRVNDRSTDRPLPLK
jgi:hypothetical protein